MKTLDRKELAKIQGGGLFSDAWEGLKYTASFVIAFTSTASELIGEHLVAQRSYGLYKKK